MIKGIHLKSRKITALDKISKVVHFDRLKDRYYKKVEEVFKREARKLKGRSKIFCRKVPNNFDIINRKQIR